MILACDPGGTTGFAWCGSMGESFGSTMVKGGTVPAMDWAYDFIQDFFTEAIVVERYTITQHTAKLSQQHDPLEIIGGLRWFAARYSLPFVLQSPSDAKRFATTERLKSRGWYKPGAGHDNDASRHLMLYAVKTGLVLAKELL